MTGEFFEKAKECKSAEELLALAKETGTEMRTEEAAELFKKLHAEGELSDDELDAASGGSCNTGADCGDTVILTGGSCPSCNGISAVYIKSIPYDAAPDEYVFRCTACSRSFSLRANRLSDITAGANEAFGGDNLI